MGISRLLQRNDDREPEPPAVASRTFAYRAYGLTIRSHLRLPELVSGSVDGDPDVEIHHGVVPRPAPGSAAAGCWQATPRAAYVCWPRIGAIAILDGREIVVDPGPGTDEEVFRVGILGPALGLLLQQRGCLVLHAGAVAVDGGAVLFLGAPGWGKSTTVAAMYGQGYGLLTDDMAVIKVEGQVIRVLPGIPHVRLLPDMAATLEDGLEGASALAWDKQGFHARHGFPQDPLPICRIYVLAPEIACQIEPRSRQEAFLELVCHSYAERWLRPMGVAGSHFLQCAALARHVGVHRLGNDHGAAALPRLIQAIKADLAGTP